MELTLVQFLTGLFSLILAVISIYVGLYIASRYRKVNNKILLYFGIGWIGFMNGFWPSAINFILVITTGTAMSLVPYSIIGLAFLPWWLIVWMIGITELLYKEKQKPIMIFTLIFAIIYDSVLFFYVFTGDHSKIGALQGPVDVKYTGLVALMLLSLLIIVVVTGILLAINSLKSDTKETKLRGIFILYTFLSWIIAAIYDGMFDLNVITLIIVRIVLITCSISAYIGFLMPKFVKRIFGIKE